MSQSVDNAAALHHEAIMIDAMGSGVLLPYRGPFPAHEGRHHVHDCYRRFSPLALHLREVGSGGGKPPLSLAARASG